MNYSMDADTNCNDSGCTVRWPALTSAVNATLTATSGSINWGLKLFSSTGNGCTVNNGVEVAVSSSSVSQIQTQISNTTPGGNTPTAQTIQAVTAYYKTVTDGNSHGILLVTDGEPNCAPGGSSTPNVQATVDAITAAYQAGLTVYVIGIGPSVGNLDNFAQAGGTGLYYPATSPQSLADAVASITRIASTTCHFQTPQAPPDASSVYVYVDKVLINQVAQSTDNGWVFGATTSDIVLTGSYCSNLLAGTASTVQLIFGCKGYVPPTIIP